MLKHAKTCKITGFTRGDVTKNNPGSSVLLMIEKNPYIYIYIYIDVYVYTPLKCKYVELLFCDDHSLHLLILLFFDITTLLLLRRRLLLLD